MLDGLETVPTEHGLRLFVDKMWTRHPPTQHRLLTLYGVWLGVLPVGDGRFELPTSAV